MANGKANSKERAMGVRDNDDIFGGDFSQARAEQRESWPAKLQWHGGISRAPGESFPVRGGFFLPESGIYGLGLDVDQPPADAEATTMQFAGKSEPGWGFRRIDIAILADTFFWEDRQDGRQRYHRDEYRLRQQRGAGEERELRGRLYVLGVVRQLHDLGVREPLLLTLRGAASRTFAALLREHLLPLADLATRMRQQKGHSGPVPREAFWLPVLAGPMTRVGGEEGKQSDMALPETTIPAKRDLPAGGAALVELARPYLVPVAMRQPGGDFDQIWDRYQSLWESFTLVSTAQSDENQPQRDEGWTTPAESAEETDSGVQPLAKARAAAVTAAVAVYPDRDPQRLADYVDTQAAKLTQGAQPGVTDYERVAQLLRERQVASLAS